MSPGRTQRGWWALQDLNLGPTDYESAALTAELRARLFLQYDTDSVKHCGGKCRDHGTMSGHELV